jgi:drug/metabolite transporter (DMT)-like permease
VATGRAQSKTDSLSYEKYDDRFGSTAQGPAGFFMGSSRCVSETEVAPHLVLVSIGGSLFVCLMCLMYCTLGPIGYALVSMICFGNSIFLLGYANELSSQPCIYLYSKFGFQGCIGAIVHAYLQYSDPSKQYPKEFGQMQALNLGSKILCFLLPAIGLIVAEYSANIGFGIDPCNAGINSSVISLDPIIVLLFFWFYSGEKPSLLQFAGTLIAVPGAILNGFSGSMGDTANAIAIAWCVSAMVSFALNIITSRLASSAEVGNKVPWAWQQIMVGFTAILMCVCQLILCRWVPSLKIDLANFSPAVLHWALIGACAQSMGIYSVIMSFQGPNVVAGVNAAIFGSCDLVNFSLDWILLRNHPNPAKLVSMGIMVFGVIILSTAS